MYSLYPVFNDFLLFLPINEIEKCQLVKVSWWDSIDRNWKSLPRRILSQITIGQECLAYANFSDDAMKTFLCPDAQKYLKNCFIRHIYLCMDSSIYLLTQKLRTYAGSPLMSYECTIDYVSENSDNFEGIPFLYNENIISNRVNINLHGNIFISLAKHMKCLCSLPSNIDLYVNIMQTPMRYHIDPAHFINCFSAMEASCPRRKSMVISGGFNGTQVELLKTMVKIFQESKNPKNLWNNVYIHFHSMSSGPARRFLLNTSELKDYDEFLISERPDGWKLRIKFPGIYYKEYDVEFQVVEPFG